MEEGEFIPMKLPKSWKWEQERKKRVEMQKKRDVKLLKLFKENKTVRHIYAVIGEEGNPRPQDIAYELKLDVRDVRAICRQLTDEWLLWDSYMTISSDYAKDRCRSFSGYLRHYIEREEGEWYHDAVLAVLQGNATEQQKMSYEHLKERWSDEMEEKVLRLENAMLRMDLKIALTEGEVRPSQFLKTFGFHGRRTLSSVFGGAIDGVTTDKAYAWCKNFLTSWTSEDVKNTIKAIQRSRRYVGKKYSQLDAIGEIIARVAKAYVKLYEQKRGEER